MISYAIIVLYEPDVSALASLCNSIIDQGFNVVLVDNSEKVPVDYTFNIRNCVVISNKQNFGIAYAQNIGVKYALSQGAETIVFFDQDSVVEAGLLDKLSEPIRNNKQYVTAPVSIDKSTGAEYPSHVINKFGWTSKVYSREKSSLVPVDIVISSGMTASSEVFKQVGFFDEDFFIDFVDIEWCIRCKSKGIQIFVVPGATMAHKIGEKTFSVGPITLIKHSPIRTYYKVRNSILLFRKRLKILFSIKQVLPALIHNLLLVFFVENKADYFTYYIKGIYHGIAGRVGKYQAVENQK